MAEIFVGLGQRRKSPHTPRAYREDFMSFVRFAGIAWPDHSPTLLKVTIHDVQAFPRRHARKEPAPKTINRRIASLSSFYKVPSCCGGRAPATDYGAEPGARAVHLTRILTDAPARTRRRCRRCPKTNSPATPECGALSCLLFHLVADVKRLRDDLLLQLSYADDLKNPKNTFSPPQRSFERRIDTMNQYEAACRLLYRLNVDEEQAARCFIRQGRQAPKKIRTSMCRLYAVEFR